MERDRLVSLWPTGDDGSTRRPLVANVGSRAHARTKGSGRLPVYKSEAPPTADPCIADVQMEPPGICQGEVAVDDVVP
jgi:hypothetical protein